MKSNLIISVIKHVCDQHTHYHLGFLLRYFIGILLFFILHLDPWSILRKFCKGCKVCVLIHFFCMWISSFPVSLVKLIIFHLHFPCSFFKDQLNMYIEFIYEFSILFHWFFFFFFFRQYHTALMWCSFKVSPEIGKHQSSNFVLLQYCFGYSE